MKFIAGAATNIGTTKSVNQDSMTLRIGSCNNRDIAMVILCDGMGGLQNGEVASSMTINKFIEWSDNRLPELMAEYSDFAEIKADWDKLLNDLNNELYSYGQENRVNLGTTISGILIIDDSYLIVNVGDSRTYSLKDSIVQITEDQSVMAREIKLGRITPEQALTDPRRNVLLQCIGATANLEIEYYEGKVKLGQAFLVCSDGLRHMVNEEELYEHLKPNNMENETDIDNGLNTLIVLNMERNETDNITAAYIKAVQE